MNAGNLYREMVHFIFPHSSKGNLSNGSTKTEQFADVLRLSITHGITTTQKNGYHGYHTVITLCVCVCYFRDVCPFNCLIIAMYVYHFGLILYFIS